jgi:hypothetical protein
MQIDIYPTRFHEFELGKIRPPPKRMKPLNTSPLLCSMSTNKNESAAFLALMDLDIERVAIREAQEKEAQKREEEAGYHGRRVVLDKDVEKIDSSTSHLFCCWKCLEIFPSFGTLNGHYKMVHRRADLRARGVLPAQTEAERKEEAQYHGKPLNVDLDKEERLCIRTKGYFNYCGECHEIFTTYRARTDHFRVVHSASSPEPPRQPTINSDALMALM